MLCRMPEPQTVAQIWSSRSSCLARSFPAAPPSPITRTSPVSSFILCCTLIIGLSLESAFCLVPLQDSPEALTKALRWTYITGGVLTLLLIFVWPLLALPAGVFSQGYFTMWIVIALIWGLLASVGCIFVPIYESAGHVSLILKNAMKCAPVESRVEAVADAAKDVLPPVDMVGPHHVKV